MKSRTGMYPDERDERIVKEGQVKTNIFDRHLWKRFWEIARLYWFSADKWSARGVLALSAGIS
ncbi:MAG: hypothetical protein ACYC5X_06195 [Syntrophales bacterium]